MEKLDWKISPLSKNKTEKGLIKKNFNKLANLYKSYHLYHVNIYEQIDGCQKSNKNSKISLEWV